MLYCVPANAAHEVPALAAAGAGELYCGIQEAWWQERYGDHDSISRRQGRANLSTREELAQLVAVAGAHDLPVFLALNGHYDERQLDYLVDLSAAFERMGGTGVIVRDLGLLWRLRESRTSLVRVLSLLAACANGQSARVFMRLGISRIVLPRFIDARVAGEVLRAVPGMEAESMVFFDKCPLVDGYCEHYHGVGYAPRTGADAQLSGEPLYTFCTTYTTHACLARVGLDSSCAYPNPYPCGACEVAAFERAGARFGKLGGRGRPLEERLRALEFLRSAESLESDKERAELYGCTFGGACSCYYGAATQSMRSIEQPKVVYDKRRVYVGSQTSPKVLTEALEGTPPSVSARTLMVPPASQEWLSGGGVEKVLRWARRCQESDAKRGVDARRDVHICVNDLGTLADLLGSAEAAGGKLKVTVGSLLVGGGVPTELGQFVDESLNPPRAVWDADGKPRVLTYRKPTDELLDHWTQGLRLENRPSLRKALSFVADGQPIEAEFPQRD